MSTRKPVSLWAIVIVLAILVPILADAVVAVLIGAAIGLGGLYVLFVVIPNLYSVTSEYVKYPATVRCGWKYCRWGWN